MGLGLVAHYYDRAEALIVSATLDAAGVPNWVENYHQNVLQPFHEIALGGYRVIVVCEGLSDAVALIHEARRAPITDGGELIAEPLLPPLAGWLYLLGIVLSPLLFLGIRLPVQFYKWR